MADATRTTYSRCLLVIAVVILLFSLSACTHNERQRRGAATPERLVAQYLQALETKDERAILNLGLETVDIAADVKTRLDRFGGRKIQQRQVTYIKSKPVLWSAKIRGVYTDLNGVSKKFADSLVLMYQSKGEVKLYAGRWYLLFDDRPQ